MNILKVMGCTSNQYASMERYLVEKSKRIVSDGGTFVVIYENHPVSEEFIRDFEKTGGILLEDKLEHVLDIACYRRLSRIIKQYDIDVVHNYFTPTCHRVAIYLKLTGFSKLVRSAANMPYVIPAGKDFDNYKVPLKLRIRHRFLSFFVKSIICRSEAVRQSFIKAGVKPEKTALGDGGCNVEKYQFSEFDRATVRSELGFKDDDLVLGVCCRLVPVKRIDRLIERCSEAVESGIKLKLVIAGDGPEMTCLKKIAANHKNFNIFFLGQKDNLVSFYSALDIFCLSSESEGMSNSILEAMAVERPVMVTDIPPNRGLVIPEKSGFMISYDDDGEFISCLEKLLAPDIRRQKGMFNRQHVVDNFSLEARLNKELAIYEKTINQ